MPKYKMILLQDDIDEMDISSGECVCSPDGMNDGFIGWVCGGTNEYIQVPVDMWGNPINIQNKVVLAGGDNSGQTVTVAFINEVQIAYFDSSGKMAWQESEFCRIDNGEDDNDG